MVVLSIKSVAVLVNLVYRRNLPSLNNTFESACEKNVALAISCEQGTSVTSQSHVRLDVSSSFAVFLLKVGQVPKFDHAIFGDCG